MWKPARELLRHPAIGLTLGAFNQPYLLARCYGFTDKTVHGYLPYYAQHLGPVRMRRNTVLEIGIGGYDDPAPSGSLRVWRDYFPRSVIAGLDIHEKDVHLGPRVKVFQGDQSSSSDLARVTASLGQLDIVIDDGSHVGAHQIASFKSLFGALCPGGWYVIEDLSTSYYSDFGGAIPAPPISGVGLLKDLIDAVQVQDDTFVRHPEWGVRPPADYSTVQEVHAYPGIAFIKKTDAGLC